MVQYNDKLVIPKRKIDSNFVDLVKRFQGNTPTFFYITYTNIGNELKAKVHKQPFETIDELLTKYTHYEYTGSHCPKLYNE
jgi:predicted nuclease of predicted toxin-antitoxin system